MQETSRAASERSSPILTYLQRLQAEGVVIHLRGSAFFALPQLQQATPFFCDKPLPDPPLSLWHRKPPEERDIDIGVSDIHRALLCAMEVFGEDRISLPPGAAIRGLKELQIPLPVISELSPEALTTLSKKLASWGLVRGGFSFKIDISSFLDAGFLEVQPDPGLSIFANRKVVIPDSIAADATVHLPHLRSVFYAPICASAWKAGKPLSIHDIAQLFALGRPGAKRFLYPWLKVRFQRVPYIELYYSGYTGADFPVFTEDFVSRRIEPGGYTVKMPSAYAWAVRILATDALFRERELWDRSHLPMTLGYRARFENVHEVVVKDGDILSPWGNLRALRRVSALFRSLPSGRYTIRGAR